jgi:hypothetical protein
VPQGKIPQAVELARIINVQQTEIMKMIEFLIQPWPEGPSQRRSVRR